MGQPYLIAGVELKQGVTYSLKLNQRESLRDVMLWVMSSLGDLESQEVRKGGVCKGQWL